MGDGTPKKQLGRKRRENVKGGRQHRHEVWVTPEEEARLLARAEAQKVTIPRLLAEAALSDAGETSTERRAAMSELFAMRRDLAGLATNVNQLARIANTYGDLPVGTVEALRDIRRMVDRIDVTIDGLAAP